MRLRDSIGDDAQQFAILRDIQIRSGSLSCENHSLCECFFYFIVYPQNLLEYNALRDIQIRSKNTYPICKEQLINTNICIKFGIYKHSCDYFQKNSEVCYRPRYCKHYLATLIEQYHSPLQYRLRYNLLQQ